MLTQQEIEEMKVRLSDASPGEWVSFIEGRDHTSGDNFIRTGDGTRTGNWVKESPDIYLAGASHADQDFIAHSRQDMEILIAEIERLWSLAGK